MDGCSYRRKFTCGISQRRNSSTDIPGRSKVVSSFDLVSAERTRVSSSAAVKVSHLLGSHCYIMISLCPANFIWLPPPIPSPPSSIILLHHAVILVAPIDGNVYIWNKEQAKLIEVLPGHSGTVNSVTWNPMNAQMFASASDDCTIRMYVLLMMESVSWSSSHSCSWGKVRDK